MIQWQQQHNGARKGGITDNGKHKLTLTGIVTCHHGL